MRNYQVICVLLLLLFHSTSLVLAEPKQTVRIAIITDLTGPGAFWGSQTVLGADQAAKEINQNQELLKLFVYDSKLQPKEAIAVAQKALLIDHVDAVFSDFAAPSIAISELVEQQKKILLYAAAARSILSSNRYAFKTYLNYIEGCKLLAERAKQGGVKAIAHLKPISEFGDLCDEGVRMVFPEYEVAEFNYGDDVLTQVKRLQSKKIETIISMAYVPDLNNLVKALSQYNFKPKIFTSTETVTPELLKKFPKYKGQFVGFGYPPTPASFVVKVRSSFPNREITYAPTVLATYVHVKQLYQILSSCSLGDIDCQTIALEQIPDPEFGFFNFKDREADVPIVLNDF